MPTIAVSNRVRCLSTALLLVVACRSARNDVVTQGDDAAGTSTSGDNSGAAASTGSGAASTVRGTGGSSPGDGSVATVMIADAGPEAPPIPVCTSGMKLCAGSCVAIDDPKYGCDPTLCDGSACPSVPGATLVCQSGVCTLGVCAAGSKKCGGGCVSIADPAYGCGMTTCDASACPNAGVGGTVVCQSGACVIGACAAGAKKCGTKCVDVSDPTYGCGAATCDATGCPAAGTGTLVCQGGACAVGTCGTGTKKCGDKCVPLDANNGCGDVARCTPCASNEACMGAPVSACTCVPVAMATACSGKCGPVANGCGERTPVPTAPRHRLAGVGELPASAAVRRCR